MPLKFLITLIFNLSNFISKSLTYFKNLFFYKYLFGYFGKNSFIDKPLKLKNPQSILIGENCGIMYHSRIEALTKWKHNSYKPLIKFNDNVSIGPRLHMASIISITIGSNTTISSDVMIIDHHHSFSEHNKNHLLQDLIGEKVEIGDNCFVGAGSKIFPGVKIGNNTIIGANSLVNKSFSGNCIIAGNPAKIIKVYDENENKWIKQT